MMVLALEASTSAAKALLYDSEQGILATESEAYTREMDKGGKQDTEAVFRATLEAGRRAAARRDVAAVAVGGVWHSTAVCDDNMRPVIPTHVWTYTGASDMCRRVREDTGFSKQIYDNTGCMPNVTYSPYTIRHLIENGLDVKQKRFCSQAGYNFYRMTGERLETASMVSGMGLLDTHNGSYSELALRFAGIEREQLNPLGSYRSPRPLSKACAELLGISAGIPVVPPYSDGAMNQVGNRAGRPGVMTFSVGTSAAIRLSTDHPVLSDPPGTWCYVGADGWLSGAATAGACNCINWFKETFLQNKWSFRELEEILLDASDTPVFLPFLFGERCPGWQDERRGGFSGLNENTSAPRLFQAVCEGVLFNVYQCYQILTELSGIPERIILSGGILNSPKWTQLCADIWGRDIAVSQTAQASMLGGAALALHAAGGIDDLADFLADELKTVSPREAYKEHYQRQFQKYLDQYDSSKTKLCAK